MYFRAVMSPILRDVTLILRGQTIENTANPNDPDFCENIFWRKYRIIWRISRPAYSMVRCGRRGLGDGLGEGLGFPKCKFKREDNKRRVLRSEKVEIPWTGFGEL
jgi:hypothetical protein